MLLSPKELQSNLERLRTNILSKRCCEPVAASDSSAQQAAGAMPLSHTTSEKRMPGTIKVGALLSPEMRSERPRSVDALLNGGDEICFYLGSAAFPGNEFGFLFSSTLTSSCRDRASATPFDSGGCMRRYDLPPGTNRLAHVRSHKMPVPECREYLGDLLASHFMNSNAYLAGQPFTCPVCMKVLDDPHNMPDYDLGLVRTHEVRISGRVDLEFPSLLAIFAPQGNVPPSLATLIMSGVELVTYEDDGGKQRGGALRQISIDYILDKILN